MSDKQNITQETTVIKPIIILLELDAPRIITQNKNIPKDWE